ncbi:MAG: TRAP transporter fused permease subunit [Gammaproteobacteria bacterium]|nr:TRAP transporter fused permease subunit [Gammaproteobacteria bacterium]
MAEQSTSPELERFEEPGEKRLTGLVYWIALFYGGFGLLVAINQTFSFNAFGFVLIDNAYYYLLIGIFLPLAFLIFPATKSHSDRVPLYDWMLFVATIAASYYLSYHGADMVQQGWDIAAPALPTAVAAAICFLALEGVRRAGGWILFCVCLVFFTFPLWTQEAPGFLWGMGKTPLELVRSYAMGFESIVGVPMRVAGNILIGFLVFGAALVVTGGGEFFMNFAAALLGKSRGGPAKVAIVSSGFFGSLSGSVISNVVTTGQLTIPTMKRAGYPPSYAGAVEACASTGGTLMPPVMGAVAFIMAEFLNIPYSDIVIAAAVPSILFYVALLLQVDCYAAVQGLKGQSAEEIPSMWQTLKEGWFYLFSLGLLVYLLVFARLQLYAPYYATIALLVAVAIFRKQNRFNLKQFMALIVESTKTISNIIAILAGIGVIVGSLAFTGVGGAFSRELVGLAQGSLWLLLVMGAITSFLLGMGVTVSACYIFLAIVMGPALIEFGLDPIASHLFILYWGMLSYITPPVALAAVAASVIAGSKQMETAFMAMRLGSIKFILPFIVVVTPALIIRGAPLDVVLTISACTVAVVLMACGFEGYLYGVGKVGALMRTLLFLGAGGFLYPDYTSYMVATIGTVIVYCAAFMTLRGRPQVASG